MWREQGYMIIRNFLNVTPQIHAMSNIYPPSRKDEKIHDFGNDGKTTFPCNYEAFNYISVKSSSYRIIGTTPGWTSEITTISCVG